MIKLCRFTDSSGTAKPGLLVDELNVKDLSGSEISGLTTILESENPVAMAERLAGEEAPVYPLSDVSLLSPLERQEVWAAGVTYLRSKTARMEESDFSATAYDRVYDAPRPEIFFKSLAEKTVATRADVGIRADAKWNVPEAELALVVNSRGELVGYSIGNDMSSRDIEGENLLYLPQAKVYKWSCSFGPYIVIGPIEEEVREWTISVKITRGGDVMFTGETSISQIKRSFAELTDYLCRSQDFPNGAALLTGTGVVPGDEFTLAPADRVTIHISGIGELTNQVVIV